MRFGRTVATALTMPRKDTVASTSSRPFGFFATPVLLFLVLHDQISFCQGTGEGKGESSATFPLKLRLYLVRHGESSANELGVLAGQQDVPLTYEGVAQAKALGRLGVFWRDTDFSRVCSSDLIRAKNTATLLLQAASREDLIERIQFDERLRERSYGARQGMSKHMRENDAIKIWKSRGVEPPLYETDADLWRRSSDWLASLVEELYLEAIKSRQQHESTQCDSQQQLLHVLVSSHAGIIREMLKKLISEEELRANGAKFDASRNDRLIIPNTSVSVIEFEITSTAVVETKSFLKTGRLLQLAITDHLESIRIHDD